MKLLGGAGWPVVKVTDDIQRVKWLGTSWLDHVALHLYGWLAFTWDSCSVLSEFLWNPHLPQLHLYRSATGYFICYLCSSSMSYGAFPLHGTVRFGTASFWGVFHCVQYLVPGTFFSTTSVEVPSKHFFFFLSPFRCLFRKYRCSSDW